MAGNCVYWLRKGNSFLAFDPSALEVWWHEGKKEPRKPFRICKTIDELRECYRQYRRDGFERRTIYNR